MRIGLRVFYNRGWMGGINYVLNIAQMLQLLPEHERPHVTFLTTTPDSVAIANENRDLADEIAPFSATRSLGLDFVYPATQMPEAPFGVSWAGWIPDWQCQHYPELFAPEERHRRFLQYRELARRPATCIFSSQQAIADTRRLFPHVADVDWRVFHFPAVFPNWVWKLTPDDVAATRTRFRVPEQYFIVCNQFWKHKNHIAVFEALARDPDLDIHVVMTGSPEDKRWPEYHRELQELMTMPEIARRVTLTGQVSRDDQLHLLVGAEGIIQPSLFEGWSTFVEEARALAMRGTLSRIPVHQEQSPEGMTFFDGTDPDSLLSALRQLISDTSPRRSLSARQAAHQSYALERAREFMAIARDTALGYNPARHELVSVLADAIPEVYDETDADGSITQEDRDRWLANIRLQLRDHPEDLARLAARLVARGDEFAERVHNLLVLATLVKCDGQTRARFLDFEPDQEEQQLADAVYRVQQNAGGLDTQVELGLRNALFRLKDIVRRKLPQ